MSQDKQKQIFNKFMEEIANTLSEEDECRRKLTLSILEEISDEKKLLKLRTTILEHNSRKDVTSLMRSNILIEDDPDVLETIRYTLARFNTYISLYRELFQKIGNVIREETLTNEKKIKIIGNLLL